MFDPSDPRTFWLSITNVGLGLVTIVCCVVVARALFRDVADRLSARSHKVVESDDHAYMHPHLGLTMADGGEKIEREKVH
jgi:hypothetical protein